MAKKRRAKKSVFENGWRVLVSLPTRDGLQVGIVGETGKRKIDKRKGSWVWVNIDGHWFLVPEKDVEHKIDEPYCAEFVKKFQHASLVRRKENNVEYEYIVTPRNKKGYLKGPDGAGASRWYKNSGPVNRMWEKLLDEVYKRLTTQAATAGS